MSYGIKELFFLRLSAAFNLHRPNAPDGFVPAEKHYASLARKKISSGALIVRKDGRILLQWKKYGQYPLGLPGGMVDDNEAPRQALVRECWEEMRLRHIGIQKLLCANYYHDGGDKLRGDGENRIYLCDIGNQRPGRDRKEVRTGLWLRPQEAFSHSRMHPRTAQEIRVALQAYKEERFIECVDGVELVSAVQQPSRQKGLLQRLPGMRALGLRRL